MRRRGIAAALLFLSRGAVAAEPSDRVAPPKVALLVSGADPVQSGSLQRAIESRLVALPQIRLRSSEQIVSLVYALGTDVPASEPVPAGAADLLSQVARAYYDDRLDDAVKALALLDSPQHKRPLVRVRALLWKAAVAQAKKQDPAAFVKDALALAPDLEVDGRVYPPSLHELVTSVRPKLGRSASIAITGAPPGASIRVDDRLVEGRVPVSPGKHLVVVSRRGYVPVETIVNAQGDSVATIALPILLSPEIDAAVAGLADGSGSGAAPLANLLEADALIVVKLANKQYAARAWGSLPGAEGSSSFPEGSAGQASLLDWIEARLKPEVARGPQRREWTWAVTGGLAGAARERRLTGSGQTLDAAFGGVGPMVVARVEPGRWRGDFDVSLVQYAFGGVQATFPDGSQRTVTGGSTLSARAAGGFAIGGGRTGREDEAEAIPQLAVSWERHSADDVADERGGLGVFPSHERIALEIGARAGAPLARLGSGPLRVEARAAYAPFASWKEMPSGSSGRSPGISSDWSAGLGLRWEGRPWFGSLEVTAAHRALRFEGEADVPTEPPISRARVTDDVQAFSLTFGRAF